MGDDFSNNAAWISHNRFVASRIGNERKSCPSSAAYFYNAALIECLAKFIPHHVYLNCDNIVQDEPVWG